MRLVLLDDRGARILISAPMARALIGKSLNDEVALAPQRQEQAPRILQFDEADEAVHFVIVGIDYQDT